MSEPLRIDEIGDWSAIKLYTAKRCARADSTILTARKNPSLHHSYIDAFARAGIHRKKATQEFVPGSPLNALKGKPPFRQYHWTDIRQEKLRTDGD
jgi:hypothetical protein